MSRSTWRQGSFRASHCPQQEGLGLRLAHSMDRLLRFSHRRALHSLCRKSGYWPCSLGRWALREASPGGTRRLELAELGL